MKLKEDSIVNEKGKWVGYILPSYDRKLLKKNTYENPVWLHFGAGNIFRAFPAVLAQRLIEKGKMDTGIICCEGYDEEIIEKCFRPYDNLSVVVTLNSDGTKKKEVVGSVTESLTLQDDNRLREIFRSASLQMVSFTITEKGYSLSEFAEMVDISPGYLSQIENGRKTNPRLDIILRIIHELDIDIEMLLGIEPTEDKYLSRIPSLLKLTLAKERNLNTLSDQDVLRKINNFLDRVLEARYVLENRELYNLFLEDVAIQTENALKRYMALKILMMKEK